MAWNMLIFIMAISAVTLGCLLPAGWLPLLPHDKLLHFVAYAGLTVLAWRLAPAWPQFLLWQLGLLLAGALIELLQQLVPGRSFCWRDLAANAAGISAAAGSILLIRIL